MVRGVRGNITSPLSARLYFFYTCIKTLYTSKNKVPYSISSFFSSALSCGDSTIYSSIDDLLIDNRDFSTCSCKRNFYFDLLNLIKKISHENITSYVFSGVQFTDEAVQKHFDEFFADIYCELEEKVSVDSRTVEKVFLPYFNYIKGIIMIMYENKSFIWNFELYQCHAEW